MINIFVLLLSFFVPVSIGSNPIHVDKRIRNGNLVYQWRMDRAFPFVVSIQKCDKHRLCSRCAGTLIAFKMVLTTAHCVCGDIWRITIFFSSVFYTQGSRTVIARVHKKRFPVPCRADRYYGDKDIAVLTWDDPIHDIRPVPLRCTGPYKPYEPATILGYAGTRLRSGMIFLTKCKKEWPGAFCMDYTKDTVVAPVHGDSGGPLLLSINGEYKQIGVMHAGSPKRRGEKAYVVWTELKDHCWWIFM